MKALFDLIHRNWRTVAAALAIGVDLVIIHASYLVAASIFYADMQFDAFLGSHRNLFIFSSIVYITLFTAFGIYRTVAYTPMKLQFFAASKAYIYGGALILCTVYLIGNIFYHRHFLVLFFIVFPFVYGLGWILLRSIFRLLRSHGLGRWNTLVIGSGLPLENVLRRFKIFPDLGFETLSVLQAPLGNGGGDLLKKRKKEIEQGIVRHKIEYMVLSSPDLNGSYDVLTDLCKNHYVRMRVVSPETDILFHETGIHDIAGLPMFSPVRGRIDRWKRLAKRGFDIVGSIVLLLVLSPIFLVVAIATRLESHGPVFFKQKRSLTDKDAPFEFYKFRSMHHEADEKKESLFKQNESDGALFKMKEDPRLTNVGKYIRRFSIDELPQLFNVLKGDMSLVGPRPLPKSDFKWVKDTDAVGNYFRGRSAGKPGMTGLWQVSGRSDLGFREMVMLDLYYIDNQSILFDLEILARTIPVVLFGKGAY